MDSGGTRGSRGVGGGGGGVDGRSFEIQPGRASAPNPQGQGRRGGQLMREVLSLAGGIPQWQPSTPGDPVLDGGRQVPGTLQGGGQLRAQLGGGAGVESNPIAAPFFSCIDDLSASVEHAANGNGFYSNMMTDESIEGDLYNNSNTCLDQQSQSIRDHQSPAATTASPNHKRSKNFSDQEDEILVVAWLNISLDPVVGKDQKGGRYWSHIYEFFHEHKTFTSQRTLNSLMHRWETIQKSVNKFCGCLTRIELRRQSGTTNQDMVAQACALYKSEDDHSKPFQFMHCWNKLRTQPKWLAKMDELSVPKTSNKKQKTNSISDPNERVSSDIAEIEVQAVEDNQLIRPIGKKRAKATLIQEKKKSVTTTLESMWAQKKESDGEKEVKKEERFNKAFALEQERVANEKLLVEVKKEEVKVKKEEVQLQKRRDEERIMTLDVSDMPDEQKQYYMYLKAQILSRLSTNTN